MISKQDYLDNLINEINIIRHLGTKITPEILDYKPTEKQRTTLELMNYLGHAFLSGVTVMANKNNGSMFAELAQNGPQVTLENFDQVMQNQAEQIKSLMNEIKESDLQEEFVLFGRNGKMSVHLLSVFSWASAYKMQLFLYIKSCGNDKINTMNLWAGIDPAPKE